MNMPWWTVIGVVPDVVTRTLLDTRPEPAIYRPIDRDWGVARITLVVRLSGGDAAASLRKLAGAVQPGPTMPVITSLEQQLNESAAEPRFTMVVLIAFAALAVVLAATGLYGVIAYTVAQRAREIGVRIVLGATRPTIARLVIGNGLRLAVSGVILGLIAATGVTRLIEHLLYGVSRFDPFAFVGGAVFLVVISVLACVVPMLRATSVDPIVAVRAD
jgi:ABC-type antimicrobial peptide transport system permease subunit